MQRDGRMARGDGMQRDGIPFHPRAHEHCSIHMFLDVFSVARDL